VTSTQSKLEYRVKWRREGRQHTYRIYQTWNAAYRKAQGILALEDVKDGTSLASLPALAEPPSIEERPCGGWEPSTVVIEVTDHTRDSMRQHFPPQDREDAWF
jgi:hypothetical protein